MIDPNISMKILQWQTLAKQGKLSREEMREAITLLRGDRKMAQTIQAIKKEKKNAEATNAQALLDAFKTEMPESKIVRKL